MTKGRKMPKSKPGPSADVVRKWLEMSADLSVLKDKEMEARKEIVDHILIVGRGKSSPKTGLIGPFKLTATPKTNLKIDKELLKTFWPSLTKEEKACFKFDPSLKAKEYSNLPADSDVHRAIEANPGAPTLKMKYVKGDDK
jgi:hypothetical protein